MDKPIVKKKHYFQSASALLTLAIDNALFGVNALSLGLSTPVIVVLAFVITFGGVYFIQQKAEDTSGQSSLKALVLAVIAAVPTSIAGSVFSVGILALAGLKK